MAHIVEIPSFYFPSVTFQQVDQSSIGALFLQSGTLATSTLTTNYLQIQVNFTAYLVVQASGCHANISIDTYLGRHMPYLKSTYQNTYLGKY